MRWSNFVWTCLSGSAWLGPGSEEAPELTLRLTMSCPVRRCGAAPVEIEYFLKSVSARVPSKLKL